LQNGTSRRWQTVVYALVIVVVGAAAYSNTFSVPLLYDDPGCIVDNPSIRRLLSLSQVFSPPTEQTVSGRPIANLSLAINYAISGVAVWSYHVLNLIIHLLAGLVLFGIVRRTLASEALRESHGRHANLLALAVALIWTVHPLQTEAVTYVIQRVESLMGLFYLLTLYCVIRGISSPRSKWWYVVSVVFCALGMGTKEVMVTAPVLVLLYDRAFASGSFREAVRRRWGLYVGLAATWIPLALLISQGARSQSAGFGVEGMTSLEYARAQSPVVLRYIGLSFWPHPLVFDYGRSIPETFADIVPAASVLGVLLVGVVLLLIFRPRAGFLGAWFFLILAPTSSFLPIVTEIAAEHRMYLPLAAIVTSVVVCVALCGRSLLNRMAPGWGTRARRLGVGVIIASAVALGLATYRRNEDYRSAILLWQDTVDKWPANPRAHDNLADFLRRQGKLAEAFAQYTESLKWGPDRLGPHVNCGVILAAQGRLEEAIVYFRKAVEIEPTCAEAHYDWGVALMQLGRFGDALGHFKTAVEILPDYDLAYYHWGVTLSLLGKPEEAAVRFKRAIEVNPDYAPAYVDYGAVLSQLGKVDEAVVSYRKAIQIDAEDVKAHNNLAWLLATYPEARVRDGKEAVRLAQVACERTKHGEAGHLDTLAAAYAEVGSFAEAVETAGKAVELASSTGQDALAEIIRGRLRLFEAGRPYREPSAAPEPAVP